MEVYRLLGPVNFNPSCFLYSEEIAREKGLWRDNRPMPTKEELESVRDVKDANELYEAMVKDIYDEMEKVFGTRNDASAMAFAATWEAMSKRPSSYVDPELGFNSEEEVTTYANLKIAESDAYGVFRLKRLNQFTQNV